jgi:hypothetical protein
MRGIETISPQIRPGKREIELAEKRNAFGWSQAFKPANELNNPVLSGRVHDGGEAPLTKGLDSSLALSPGRKLREGKSVQQSTRISRSFLEVARFVLNQMEDGVLRERQVKFGKRVVQSSYELVGQGRCG